MAFAMWSINQMITTAAQVKGDECLRQREADTI